MYQLLADTYNLDADQRESLEKLGIAAWDDDSGTGPWAARVLGGDSIPLLNSLLHALGCDVERLVDFAMWYRTGKCQSPVASKPDALMCPPHPRGCRRTMGLGNFPFYPVEDRCCDCIRDSVHGREPPFERHLSAGKKLAELLKLTSQRHVAVPRITEVIGGLIALQGGVDGVVEKWHAAIEDVRESRPQVAIMQYNKLAEMIQACNEMEDNQIEVVARLDDEQRREYIVHKVLSRLTADQIKTLFEDSDNLSQRHVGALKYGEA